MTFRAKYPGRCARTGARINPGDVVQSVGYRRYALAVDPELDNETAESVGRYMAQAMEKGRCDVFNIGGAEYIRNKAGRCIDAPCCGCCTI